MKWIVILIALLLAYNARAKSVEPDLTRIVNAVYLAEGGAKAQHLYGIVSVSYKTPQEARRICQNTVRNNHKRWVRDGRPGDFVSYLGNIYCPTKGKLRPAERRLNRYWIRNVKHFYERNLYAESGKLRSQRG